MLLPHRRRRQHTGVIDRRSSQSQLKFQGWLGFRQKSPAQSPVVSGHITQESRSGPDQTTKTPREPVSTMSVPQTQDAASFFQLCRIMRPDDANIVGNVHGGTILKMIEEAGCIISTRHCNTQNGDRCVAALVRVEKTEFLFPMFIGEVAHVSAEITYASKHSLELQVKVMAENILTGVTMKLMDEVAGIVAARHCNTNVVTASMDATNFHRKIKIGCVVTVTGRMTFTSNKSMEIEVFVDAAPLIEAEKEPYRAVSAFFTYISLDKHHKALPVPPLKLEGEEERKRFDEGNTRYLHNKAKRLAAAQEAQA
ncbi:cytosolic acyl coenzyme A thioester hydrolase [Diretmus argenteus]